MLEHSHTFALVDGTEITFHFRNTLFEDIRERELIALMDADNVPDGGIRKNFCFIAARVQSVDNAPSDDWFNPRGLANASEIMAVYRRFARNVNDDTFYAIMQAVLRMKTPNQDPVTKPDENLTPEERADPKLTPPGESSKRKK